MQKQPNELLYSFHQWTMMVEDVRKNELNADKCLWMHPRYRSNSYGRFKKKKLNVDHVIFFFFNLFPIENVVTFFTYRNDSRRIIMRCNDDGLCRSGATDQLAVKSHWFRLQLRRSWSWHHCGRRKQFSDNVQKSAHETTTIYLSLKDFQLLCQSIRLKVDWERFAWPPCICTQGP